MMSPYFSSNFPWIIKEISVFLHLASGTYSVLIFNRTNEVTSLLSNYMQC